MLVFKGRRLAGFVITVSGFDGTSVFFGVRDCWSRGSKEAVLELLRDTVKGIPKVITECPVGMDENTRDDWVPED